MANGDDQSDYYVLPRGEWTSNEYLASYVAEFIDGMRQTTYDLLSMVTALNGGPAAQTQPQSISEYLSSATLGQPLVSVTTDTGGRIPVGRFNVNVSSNGEFSVTVPWEFLRFGISGRDLTVGVGASADSVGATIGTSPTQFLSGHPNLKLSGYIGNIRGTMGIEAGPGVYNIGGRLLQDFYDDIQRLGMGTASLPLR
jgi:hypothetical protein